MTADTSVLVAALAGWHERHGDANRALAGVSAAPAHALLECYSVLTRMPSGLAVPAGDAASVIEGRFAPLALPARQRARLARTLAEAGVAGGSSYDGLVALEAAAHGHELLTLDVRAAETYRRLGVTFRAL